MKPRFHGWQIYLGSRPYKAALDWQTRMVRYRRGGTIRDTLFYLEHPDVITLGRDYPEDDQCDVKGVELFRITRGGGLTYHGPGQLVVYPVIDIGRRGKDLHKFVNDIQEGIIRAFAGYGLACNRNPEHTGVWVEDRKIASIGIAVNQWISFHGAAINLTTDLKKFGTIHPCGLKPEIMTSAYKELGKKIDPEEFSVKLSEEYSAVFETKFETVDLEELTEMIEGEESSQSL